MKGSNKNTPVFLSFFLKMDAEQNVFCYRNDALEREILVKQKIYGLRWNKILDEKRRKFGPK